MPTVHERILIYGDLLYQRALERLEGEHYRRAEIAAAAAAGAGAFLEADIETPPEIRDRAKTLAKAAEQLLGQILTAEIETYGERFLSGPKRRAQDLAQKEVALLMNDFRTAAAEANR